MSSKILFLDNVRNCCRITGEYCPDGGDCRTCTIPVVLSDVAKDYLSECGCYKDPDKRGYWDD